MIFSPDRHDSQYVARRIGRTEWDGFWAEVKENNLMQSWEYGDAKQMSALWVPSRYVIESKQGDPIAILQVLSITAPVFGGIARLNRGPLMLPRKSKASTFDYAEIIRAILSLQRIKRWWLLFFAPEIVSDGSRIIDPRSLGLIQRKSVPWGSATLDLTVSVETMQARLSGKWRNLLRKSQKFELEAQQISENEVEFENVIALFEGLQASKGFSGMPSGLLRALSRVKGDNWKLSASVVKDHQPENDEQNILGMLISVIHGGTATYLIGFSNERGRKYNVNYFLLWQAILDAKSRGCEFYDLGGINRNTPKGVAHFKKGLSGCAYTLVGEYVAVGFSKQLGLKNLKNLLK